MKELFNDINKTETNVTVYLSCYLRHLHAFQFTCYSLNIYFFNICSIFVITSMIPSITRQ